MSVGVVYKISGNLEALEAILRSMSRLKVDKIVSLGSLVGRGPNPVQCVEHARSFDLVLRDSWDDRIAKGLTEDVPSTALTTNIMHPWSCRKIQAAGLAKSFANWPTRARLEQTHFATDLAVNLSSYSQSEARSDLWPRGRCSVMDGPTDARWLFDLLCHGHLSFEAPLCVLSSPLHSLGIHRDGRSLHHRGQYFEFPGRFRAFDSKPGVQVEPRPPIGQSLCWTVCSTSIVSQGVARFLVIHPDRIEAHAVPFDLDKTRSKLGKIEDLPTHCLEYY